MPNAQLTQPSLSESQRREAAAILARAQQERRPVAPLTERWSDMTLADAYAIQEINTAGRLRAGASIRGHKVGLTSEAMQRMIGVDTPDFGVVLADMVLAAGQPVLTNELVAPRAEPEIGFVLNEQLKGPGVNESDVHAATAYVLPALEIIDSRIVDWAITLYDTVADNASSARVVLGATRAPVDTTDLGSVEVELAVDGAVVARGLGADVLGNPATAVAWLANTLAQFGEAIEPGMLVMPGSLTRAVDVAPGKTISARFSDLGSVEVDCL